MIIAIDFDGCISSFREGWKGPDTFGTVVEGARAAITELHKEHTIIIHTCRYSTPALVEFLKTNGIPFDYVNDEPPSIYQAQYERAGKAIGNRKIHADLYIDDRGLRFEGDWKAVIAFIEAKKHVPWEGL